MVFRRWDSKIKNKNSFIKLIALTESLLRLNFDINYIYTASLYLEILSLQCWRKIRLEIRFVQKLMTNQKKGIILTITGVEKSGKSGALN